MTNFRDILLSLNLHIIMTYSYEQRGSLNSPDYRIYFKNQDNYISPVHDIPLWHDEGEAIANMVVEIPRWSHAKLEISPQDPLNPIHHDTDKQGNLRYIANTFPSHGYLWNYGALPQTWEDPAHTDSSTRCKGDGDPVDVMDIGSKLHQTGEVIQVKILGTIAMIDEGQTDWKVVSIDIEDPLASKFSDISDVDVYMPKLLPSTVEWLRNYKMADGKPANTFAFNARSKTKNFTLNVLRETHQQWCSLLASKKEMGFCRTHTLQTNSVSKKNIIDQEAAEEIVNEHPEFSEDLPICSEKVQTWHHVSQM